MGNTVGSTVRKVAFIENRKISSCDRKGEVWKGLQEGMKKGV